MRIEKLRMNNFRKFRNEEIEFTENLNLIEGENNAGKSSIFYAIYFALTGDAFNKGFRSPKEYITFGKSRMEVEIQIQKNEKTYFMERSYSQSSGGTYTVGRIEGETRRVLEGTENGAKVSEVNSKIEEITGLDRKTLENVVYAAQQKFVQKIEGGTDQKKALDYIFNFKTVEQLSSQMKEVIEEKEKEIEGLDTRKEQRDELRENLEDLREDREETRNDLKELEESISQQESKLEEIREEKSKIEEKKEILEEKVSKAKEVEETRSKIESLETRLREFPEKEDIQENIDEAESEISNLEDEEESLKEKLGSVEAAQEKKERIRSQLDEISEEIKSAQEQKESLEEEISETEETLKETTDEASELASRYDATGVEAVEKEMDERKDRIGKLEKQMGELESEHRGIKQTLEEGKCSRCGRPVKNPEAYRQREQELREKIEETREEKKDTKGEREELERLKELVEKADKKEERIEDLKEERNSREEKINNLEREKDRKEEELESLDDKTDSDPDVIQEKLREKRDELRDRKNSIDNLKEKLESRQELEEKIEDRKDSLPDDVPKKDLERLREELDSGKEEFSALKSDEEKTKVALGKDRERKNDLQENLEGVTGKVREKEDSLEEIEEDIERLESLEEEIEEAKDIRKVYSSSEEEMREVNLKRLERKVFKWYQELSASQEFKDLSIDRESYQLRGTPQNAGQKLGITDYQGGAQRTLTALAYQLALAEMTESTDFLMVDEPTDATDSENRENLLEMIHKAETQFNQILLITHHGAGREKAENIIKVKKADSETSEITYPVNQT